MSVVHKSKARSGGLWPLVRVHPAPSTVTQVAAQETCIVPARVHIRVTSSALVPLGTGSVASPIRADLGSVAGRVLPPHQVPTL